MVWCKNKSVVLLLIISIVLLSFASQPIKTSSTDLKREIRWQDDLSYLAHELPKLHKNVFFKISKTDFQREVEQLKQNIPTMNDDEIILGLARIVASIGDAHTQIALHQKATGFTRYPFKFYWFPSGIYVTDTTAEYKQVLGARLIKIGDSNIRAVTEKVTPLISHENDEWLKCLVPTYLDIPEVLYGLHITPSKNDGRFVFVNPLGKTITLNVQSLSEPSKFKGIAASVLPKPPLYRQNNDKYYWYTYLPESQTIYLQYNVCEDMQSQPFDDFALKLLSFADTHPIKKFVIDLRNNDGGYSTVLDPLMYGILARPNLNRKGHLFTIIGRKTFSSAMMNACELKYQSNAILIGGPTGGKPDSYGNVQEFQLPNSKLFVTYTTKYFINSPDNVDSLQPDISVPITAKDYFTGKDPVMEQILKYPQK
jgi:hypothetical protein